MKIKLLKDIPGYKSGEIVDLENYDLMSPGKPTTFLYSARDLVKDGWAEEVKDEIDIEEVRNYYLSGATKGRTTPLLLEDNEREWFTAYRIVKAVIEKLNGDWKPNWQDFDQVKWELGYSNKESKFSGINTNHWHYSIMPYVETKEMAEKVISLCEPELKVLFNVK